MNRCILEVPNFLDQKNLFSLEGVPASSALIHSSSTGESSPMKIAMNWGSIPNFQAPQMIYCWLLISCCHILSLYLPVRVKSRFVWAKNRHLPPLPIPAAPSFGLGLVHWHQATRNRGHEGSGDQSSLGFNVSEGKHWEFIGIEWDSTRMQWDLMRMGYLAGYNRIQLWIMGKLDVIGVSELGYEPPNGTFNLFHLVLS